MSSDMDLETISNPFASITKEQWKVWAGKVVAINMSTHEVIAVADSAEELRLMCEHVPLETKWASIVIPTDG